jgi:hypothetical protein
MFRLAGEIMRAEGFDFLATGEVLNERPMSQNLRALKIVEQIAGLEGYILRPLSAKCLEPTVPERSGLVDREKLFDFKGRNRKPQIALAQQYGIEYYPTPAGGCVLTEREFTEKLRELFRRDPAATPEDVKLLRLARVLFVGESSLALIGRNREENERLEKFAISEDYLISMVICRGPTALLRLKPPDQLETVLPTVLEKVKACGRESRVMEGEIGFNMRYGGEKREVNG